MLTKRKIARWETAVRQQAHDNARALAVAIVAGTAWAPPPHDLGIILEPGEIVWHRCPATYRWRGTEAWTIQRNSYWGRRTVAHQASVPCMFCLGTTDWVITNCRLATRAPDGQVLSIHWTGLEGLSVNLDAGLVVLDGPDCYHGELSGPAVAPIAVAAIAACDGTHALLEHPALVSLRTSIGRKSARGVGGPN